MSSSQNRFERRLVILRGKRERCFDRNQYYLEQAVRARAARKVRALLRRGQPVVLITPRWSSPQRFLDDIAGDLAIAPPPMHAHTLGVSSQQGRTRFQVWTYLLRALVELCELELDGPVNTAVDRHGFRAVMADLLRRSLSGPDRVLMVHGFEHLDLEARSDFAQVFEEHMEFAGPRRKINLLLANSVDGPAFELPGSVRITLPDYAQLEAVEALVEFLGPMEPTPLKAAAARTGGVPALLEAVGADAVERGALPRDGDELWRALGPLADEIRSVTDILAADPDLGDLLERLVEDGVLKRDPAAERLLVAGLARERGADALELRAPLLADAAVGL